MAALLRTIRKTASRLTISAVVYSLLISSSVAGVRAMGSDYSTLRAPTATAAPGRVQPRSSQRIFRPRGMFLIARGVVLDGGARFVLERTGGEVALNPRTLKLDVDRSGDVVILHGQVPFKVEMHRGLACPLATFVERKGEILYSLVPPSREGSLTGTGLVRGREKLDMLHAMTGLTRDQFQKLEPVVQDEFMALVQWNEWFAREFAGSPFLDLLVRADLTSDQKALPPALARAFMARQVSPPTGPGTTVARRDGSYLNTDADVTYKAILVDESKTIDISGVPLRFSWVSLRENDVRITGVTAFNDESLEGATLTDFRQEDSIPSHYDVLVLYQTAGIFAEMRRQSPVNFAAFRAKACRPAGSR